MIERRYNEKANYYAERLRDYLCENNTLFPEYNNPGSGLDTIQPNKAQSLFGGFILGEGDDCDKFYFFGE
jgi:hypothetical protein